MFMCACIRVSQWSESLNQYLVCVNVISVQYLTTQEYFVLNMQHWQYNIVKNITLKNSFPILNYFNWIL